MMRGQICAVALALALGTAVPTAAPAQVPQWLVPSPVTVVLALGRWIQEDNQRLYHVQVQSTGSSYHQAQQQALEDAVKLAVGALVVSETEVRDQGLHRREILNYSSGFVEKYQVLQRKNSGQEFSVTMDVWVSDSKIANRVQALGGADGRIDGAALAAAHRGKVAEQVTGDALVELVARDFPRRALRVDVVRSTSHTTGRQLLLKVQVHMAWQSQYLESLAEALARTASRDDFRGLPNQVWVRHPGQWRSEVMAWPDSAKEDLLRRHLIESRPQVQLSLLDQQGQVFRQLCYSVPDLEQGRFYRPAQEPYGNTWLNKFYIDGGHRSQVDLEVSGSGEVWIDQISRISTVKAQVVAGRDCQAI